MRALFAFAVVLLAAGLVSAGCTSGPSSTGDAAKRSTASAGKPSAAVKPATAAPHQWCRTPCCRRCSHRRRRADCSLSASPKMPDWLTADGDAMKVNQTTAKNALPSDELGKTTNPNVLHKYPHLRSQPSHRRGQRRPVHHLGEVQAGVSTNRRRDIENRPAPSQMHPRRQQFMPTKRHFERRALRSLRHSPTAHQEPSTRR